MTKFDVARLTTVVATALLAATFLTAPEAMAKAIYGSSASVASVSLSVLTAKVGGSPIAESSGVGAPAFDQKKMMLGGQATIALPVIPGVSPLEVVIKTPLAQSRAGGHRIADAEGVEATGASSTRTLTVALQSANQLVPLNLLTIKASKLSAYANSATSAGGVQTSIAVAKAAALKITGALLGGQTVSLGGVLTPGVIYSSPLVTITVDNVVATRIGGVAGTSVSVLDVSFTNSLIAGTPITGHIILNSAAAY